MLVDSRGFRKALSCLPTGVTVVTTRSATGEPIGVTISSFTSLSLEPPLVLFCLDNKNGHLQDYLSAGIFAVNVLRADQRELSIRFASRMEDKWQGVVYEARETGAPILAGCLANLECRITGTHLEGDHHIIIGQVTHLEYSQAGQPLIYWRGAYADLGCRVP